MFSLFVFSSASHCGSAIAIVFGRAMTIVCWMIVVSNVIARLVWSHPPCASAVPSLSLSPCFCFDLHARVDRDGDDRESRIDDESWIASATRKQSASVKGSGDDDERRRRRRRRSKMTLAHSCLSAMVRRDCDRVCVAPNESESVIAIYCRVVVVAAEVSAIAIVTWSVSWIDRDERRTDDSMSRPSTSLPCDWPTNRLLEVQMCLHVCHWW